MSNLNHFNDGTDYNDYMETKLNNIQKVASVSDVWAQGRSKKHGKWLPLFVARYGL